MANPARNMDEKTDANTPDDTGCTIIHVDLDAFFASVEIRKQPQLHGVPMVVAGTGPRSVVTAASYPARRFGIRSAMPLPTALRMYPSLTVIEPDFPAYQQASEEVMHVLGEVCAVVEQASIDEAYLDVSGAIRHRGSPSTIARTIRQRIDTELRLPCSVGVASVKFLAKIASAHCKPQGMLVIPIANQVDFLHHLPARALPGIGPKTQQALERLGLTQVRHIAEVPVKILSNTLGLGAATHLHDLSWAKDPRQVLPSREEKSIGSERTYPVDTTDAHTHAQTLLALSERVAARLRQEGLMATTLTVKVRFASFSTVNKTVSLPGPSDVAQEIYRGARTALAKAMPHGGRLRLLGVRLSGLVQRSHSFRRPTLDEPDKGRREVEQAMDRAVARFGDRAVTLGTLLEPCAEESASAQDSLTRHHPGR